MSEIKPVYQRRIQDEDDDWQEIEHSEYVEFSERGKFQTRILYPAAAYEALQKENAELKDRIAIMDEAAKYHNETIISISNKLHAENESLKLKKEFIEDAAQDIENQNAAQAKRIAELEAATELVAWGYAWECKSVGDWRIEKLGEGCIPPKDTIALYTAPERDKP